jgi:PKD repeat protein
MNCALVTGGASPSGGGGGSSPSANFRFTLNPAMQGNVVVFLDESTNSPTSWEWTVNGAIFSNQQNPAFYCANVGNFVVNLTATNAYGSDQASPQTLQVTP